MDKSTQAKANSFSYVGLFFDLIESCDCKTGEFTFKLPRATMERLEKQCRIELGKAESGADLPPVRLSLAEKIKEAGTAVAWYREQLQAAGRWSLNDLAFFEAQLSEAKAELRQLKARQAKRKNLATRDSIDVEALKQSHDLVEVAESYGLKLKKRGKEFWALCPFHQEKTASFSINREKQLYSCFGCQESGDVLSFIQKMEQVDFLEACKRLGA